MGTLITLDKAAEQTLENMRENDPDFNFSAFVRGCLTEDTTMLNQEQIDLKIRTLELDREKLDVQIEHLKAVIPFVKKVDEAKEAEHATRLANALEVLTRLKGTDRRDEMAIVHAKLTGMSIVDLIKMADDKEEKDRIDAEEKAERSRLAWEELQEDTNI